MYIKTKADHAVTTASLSVNSLLMVKDVNGNWVALQPAFVKAYPNVYYATLSSTPGDNMYTESWLPGPTKHIATMTVYSAS
jgi:hypothetical protein